MAEDPSSELANDQLVGKLAVSQGFITNRQLDDLLDRHEELTADGEEILLGELLVREELLDEAELKELLGQDRVVGGYRLLHRLMRVTRSGRLICGANILTPSAIAAFRYSQKVFKHYNRLRSQSI